MYKNPLLNCRFSILYRIFAFDKQYVYQMRKAVTLYELNQLVSDTIAASMPDEYWVEAELAEIHEVRGHCYMELIQKEPFSNTPVAKATAKCWKTKWMQIRPHFERITKQRMHAGLKIMLKVHADFHAAYGFAWIVTDIDPAYTMGDMARKRQEIITALKREGVFELQKELVLGMFAQRIAVVSSANAAGYGDFCNQLECNEYGLHFDIELFQAVMQGEQVEQSIIAALNAINERIDDFDVVVIIRGGGATSDLSGFDTLALAENVANFPLPIITGIGHERDESVLDMVSYARVKTPTAAAAYLIGHLAEVLARVEDARSEIVSYVRRRMEHEKLRLNALSNKIPILFSAVKVSQTARLNSLFMRTVSAMNRHLTAEKHHLDMLSAALFPSVRRRITAEYHRLEMLVQRTDAVNPDILLRKGYSITLYNGKLLRDVRSLRVGDEIETKVEHGSVRSVVKAEE